MRISVVSRKIVIAIITHILLIVQRRGMDRVGDRVESWTVYIGDMTILSHTLNFF